MTAFELDGVTLRRPGFTLGPLTLSIDAGGRTAVVGPSGCGKTTLLRLLAGLERATAGTIRQDGRVLSDGGVLTVPPARRRIGFVFQDGALWPHLDAVGHLRFVDPALSAAAAGELLAAVGLGERAHHRPDQLSGGEKQRLALARALAGRPQVLLLDEPLHSVDVHLRAELGLLIRTAAEQRGLGLILVTHDRDEALAIADRMVVMREGRLVEEGRAEDLLRTPRTAFTASFLCAAACLPTEIGSDGRVQTPFGTFAAAPGGEAPQLVLLPGDARVVAERNGRPSCSGTVLHVVPGIGGGDVASVRVGVQVVTAACQPGVRAGDEVVLALERPPRLLPREEPRR